MRKLPPIAISIVGLGNWGQKLARCFGHIPDAQIVSFYDHNEKASLRATSLCPQTAATTSFVEVTKSPTVEAIVLATPASSHYALASLALAAGKHVFVEKPMTCSTKDAISLIKLAAQRRKILMVDHTYVYDSAIQVIKSMVQSGQLGTVYAAQSIRTNLGKFRADCNALWDLAPHDIAILSYILDAAPREVSAQGWSQVVPGLTDTAWMHLNFPNQVHATVHVGWISPSKHRTLIVIGSKSMVVFDDTLKTQKIRLHRSSVSLRQVNHSIRPHYHRGGVFRPPYTQQEPLQRACQHFIDCVRTNAEPMTNGVQGRMVAATIEAAEASIKKGGGLVPISA